MKKPVVAAISRAKEFSPNCEKNDSLIFEEVCGRLKNKGFEVKIFCETDICGIEAATADLYLSMARGRQTITVLQEKEARGSIVINSAKSLEIYNRIEIVKAMRDNKIPMPQSEILMSDIISTKSDIIQKLSDIVSAISYPFWIKRGNECAQSPNDVSFIGNYEEFVEAQKDFSKRGITGVVVSKHEEGDLVKFYGVESTGFFYTYFPTENGGCGKFGAEKINGEPHKYSYDSTKLKSESERLSRILNIPVYGGDCIVSPNGDFKIIDFNDWPSFSRCRTDAAKAIAQLVCSKLNIEQDTTI